MSEVKTQIAVSHRLPDRGTDAAEHPAVWGTLRHLVSETSLPLFAHGETDAREGDGTRPRSHSN